MGAVAVPLRQPREAMGSRAECPVCHVCVARACFARHIKDKHPEYERSKTYRGPAATITKFKCAHARCNLEFTRRDMLQRHLRSHEDVAKADRLECPHGCKTITKKGTSARVFKDSQSLARHVRKEHSALPSVCVEIRLPLAA